MCGTEGFCEACEAPGSDGRLRGPLGKDSVCCSVGSDAAACIGLIGCKGYACCIQAAPPEPPAATPLPEHRCSNFAVDLSSLQPEAYLPTTEVTFDLGTAHATVLNVSCPRWAVRSVRAQVCVPTDTDAAAIADVLRRSSISIVASGLQLSCHAQVHATLFSLDLGTASTDFVLAAEQLHVYTASELHGMRAHPRAVQRCSLLGFSAAVHFPGRLELQGFEEPAESYLRTSSLNGSFCTAALEAVSQRLKTHPSGPPRAHDTLALGSAAALLAVVWLVGLVLRARLGSGAAHVGRGSGRGDENSQGGGEGRGRGRQARAYYMSHRPSLWRIGGVRLLLLIALLLNIYTLLAATPFLQLEGLLMAAPYSIWRLLTLLYDHGLYGLALLILCFSVLFPPLKLLLAAAATTSCLPCSTSRPLLGVLCYLGRWSLLDVMICWLFLTIFADQEVDGVLLVGASIQHGLESFTASILLSLLATTMLEQTLHGGKADKVGAPRPPRLAPGWVMDEGLELGREDRAGNALLRPEPPPQPSSQRLGLARLCCGLSSALAVAALVALYCLWEEPIVQVG